MIIPDEKLNKFVSDHASHINQIGDISSAIQTLSELTDAFNIDESKVITYLVQKIQIRYFLDSISETNKSISLCLTAKHYSSVEALARISIEMSINLMYILNGEDHRRSKGLIKYYLEKRKSNAKSWSTVASRDGMLSAQAAADSLISHLNEMEINIAGLLKDPIETWPKSIREKFVKTGYEESYTTLFASGSDSIHLQSENIFNLTTCIGIPFEYRREAIDMLRIEKESYAIYMAISATAFQYNAYITTLEKSELEEERIESLIKISEKLELLNLIHDADSRSFRT